MSSAPARSATARSSWASGRSASRPGDEDWVDVCALCTEQADEHGWIREGTPTHAARARRAAQAAPLRRARRAPGAPKGRARAGVSEPVLRRLSAPEQAMVEAAELFNDSAYRRTIAGIAKSLGEARVSFLPLSGTNPEVVITVAWDISWYQYRVVFESAQPVRLAERGIRARRARGPLQGLERAPRPRRPPDRPTSRGSRPPTPSGGGFRGHRTKMRW